MKNAYNKLLIKLGLRKPFVPTPPPKSLADILGTFTQVQTDLRELAERKVATIASNKAAIEALTASSAAAESERAKAVSVTANIEKLLK